MSITIDHTAPPGQGDFERECLERLRALEVAAVRLAEERDALRARAVKAEGEATGLLRVNVALQRELGHAAVRETVLRAEADSHAAHVRELLEERRLWLWEKARLEAKAADLGRQAETPGDAPRRRHRGDRRRP